MIKVNKNLIIFSSLLVLLGTTLLFTLQRFFPLINHVAYYCQSLLKNTTMISIPYYLNIIPFVLLFTIILISIVKLCALYIKLHLLRKNLNENISTDHSADSLIKKIGLNGKAVLIQSDREYAFCVGIRSPKIYFSTALVSKLTKKELEAVLRHEQYHLENHDPLTSVVASIAYSLFPFFPLLSDLIKKYRIERELGADKFAIEKVGSENGLISALKKLLTTPTLQADAVAAIADQDTLEPRIYSLMNKPYFRRQFRLKHLLITLFSSLLLVSIIVMPVHATEIHNDKSDFMMYCSDDACSSSCKSDDRLTDVQPKVLFSKFSGGNYNLSKSYTPIYK